MTERPLILVTNDDGVHAEGIRALREVAAELGEVVVVAPDTEQSGVSHAITLHRALRVRKHSPLVMSVDGTPTDCVYLALHKLLPQRPALVLSGINHGGNLGDDVLYSGTASAAMEAAHNGVPAVAISLVSSHGNPGDFAVAAAFALELGRHVLANPPDTGVFLNVNVPRKATLDAPYEFCALGKHSWRNVVEERHDPRGKPYYWIGGPWMGHEDTPGTDCHAVHRGTISITPVRASLTSNTSLSRYSAVDTLGDFRALPRVA